MNETAGLLLSSTIVGLDATIVKYGYITATVDKNFIL